jgi:hypothetical protein
MNFVYIIIFLWHGAVHNPKLLCVAILKAKLTEGKSGIPLYKGKLLREIWKCPLCEYKQTKWN